MEDACSLPTDTGCLGTGLLWVSLADKWTEPQSGHRRDQRRPPGGSTVACVGLSWGLDALL